jgi:hypothetical protein
VNAHLKAVAAKLEVEKLKAEVQSEKIKLQSPISESQPEMEQLDQASEAPELEDPYPSKRKETEGLDPSQMVSKRLFDLEQKRFQEKSYRDAYAQQYIESARQKGWEIVLDNDYRVISAKKIVKKKAYQLFPTADAPSQ